MNAIEVTVTVADLDKGIAAIQERGRPVCNFCVMAQAVSRAAGSPAECSSESAIIGDLSYALPEIASSIVNMFDNEAYDELRQYLPVTFVLEAR